MKGANLKKMGIRGGKRRKEVRGDEIGQPFTRREEESRGFNGVGVVAKME